MLRFLTQVFWRLALIVGMSSCAHTNAQMAGFIGKTVYNQVTFHAEFRGGKQISYSTNHFGLPTLIKLNTPLKVVALSDREMVFTLPDKSTWQLIFTAKHHQMEAIAYFKKMFDKTPLVLPQNLTEKERSAIEKGSYFIGMSRKALFLAIGYPPATLTADLNGQTLMYERKRFNQTRFLFDAKGHLEKVYE